MTEVLSYQELTHKNESLLYDSLDDEYRTVGWLGGIEIMKSIWKHYQINSEEKHSEYSLFVSFCETVSKNPKTTIKKMNKWISHSKANSTRLNILEHIGVIERIESETSSQLIIAENFYHALEIHNMSKKSKDEFISESDIARHLPVLGELVNLYEDQIIDQGQTNGKLVEQFSTIVRDIDFYIGKYDPKKDSC
jgi:hypothetical protein